MKTRVALSWSSGKDAALCLERLRETSDHEVVALFTTYEFKTGFVPIQGVPLYAVREQARCLDLPLYPIGLPHDCANDIYEATVIEALRAHASEFDVLAFGDLFLKGIREYRERFLGNAGFKLIFPLMGEDVVRLAREIPRRGIRARLCSVDRTQLSEKFCGAEFDENLLKCLPKGVDPCGERGEFHSFVLDMPAFREPLEITPGRLFADDRWTYLHLGMD